MPSKAFDFGLPFRRGATRDSDSSPPSNIDSAPAYDGEAARRASVSVSGLHDTTHRGLKARHIQLIGIGGKLLAHGQAREGDASGDLYIEPG